MSTQSDNKSHETRSDKGGVFRRFYDNNYKKMLVISILLVLFSFIVIGYHYATTKDFVNRGVSLTGGISLTLNAPDGAMTADDLQAYIVKQYPKSDVTVRTFGSSSSLKFSVEAAGIEEKDLIDTLKPKFPNLSDEDFAKNKQIIGPTFGKSFFTQTLKAMFIAFLFMSIVIFLYFGESSKHKWIAAALTVISAFTMFYAQGIVAYIIAVIIFFILIGLYIHDSIPAFGIVLCAFSDVFFSLAIFDLFGHKLSIAGVAAFLMLIGYSIDTDILLSVRVLKRKEGSLSDRIVGAFGTGITMSVCALVAVLAAYFLTHSMVIKEIMFILIAGLIGDIIFTWIQNAGILRWHLENKGWK